MSYVTVKTCYTITKLLQEELGSAIFFDSHLWNWNRINIVFVLSDVFISQRHRWKWVQDVDKIQWIQCRSSSDTPVSTLTVVLSLFLPLNLISRVRWLSTCLIYNHELIHTWVFSAASPESKRTHCDTAQSSDFWCQVSVACHADWHNYLICAVSVGKRGNRSQSCPSPLDFSENLLRIIMINVEAGGQGAKRGRVKRVRWFQRLLGYRWVKLTLLQPWSSACNCISTGLITRKRSTLTAVCFLVLVVSLWCRSVRTVRTFCMCFKSPLQLSALYVLNGSAGMFWKLNLITRT